LEEAEFLVESMQNCVDSNFLAKKERTNRWSKNEIVNALWIQIFETRKHIY